MGAGEAGSGGSGYDLKDSSQARTKRNRRITSEQHYKRSASSSDGRHNLYSTRRFENSSEVQLMSSCLDGTTNELGCDCRVRRRFEHFRNCWPLS